jgi:hypothetical protein
VDERAAFEAWYSEDGKWPMERDAKGNYKLAHAATSWTVWQARAALQAPAPSVANVHLSVNRELSPKTAAALGEAIGAAVQRVRASGGEGSGGGEPSAPAGLREPSARDSLLYRLARHIRNSDETPVIAWGFKGIELLEELHSLDPDRYEREVKARSAPSPLGKGAGAGAPMEPGAQGWSKKRPTEAAWYMVRGPGFRICLEAVEIAGMIWPAAPHIDWKAFEGCEFCRVNWPSEMGVQND